MAVVPLLLLLLLGVVGRGWGGEVVNVPEVGLIEGTSSKTAWSGKTVFEFRGVPYAQPPLGDLRFKEPQPMEPWSSTFNASEFGPACPQLSSEMLRGLGAEVSPPDAWVRASQLRRSPDVSLAVIGNEDCLTTDIYTPTLNASAKLPVFVYIHGGTYMMGSSAEHRPGFLLDRKDIVLVVPQYRLGPLGFFYLNTMDAPGNMGLADQALAIQWVRSNIRYFGGDPSQVTIGGNSAGASSVSLHMVNPLYNETHRLFDRVIASGGSALAFWGVVSAPRGLAGSVDVAHHASCTDDDPTAMAACMNLKSTEQLLMAFMEHQLAAMEAGQVGLGASTPVVQTDPPPGVTLTVPESPQRVVEEGWYVGLPMLTGTTKHEGLYAINLLYQGYLVPNNLTTDSLFLRNELVVRILDAYGVNENSRVMADACTRRYFEPEELGDFTLMVPGLLDLESVVYHKGPVFRQAELHSLKAKAYLYSFEYWGEHSYLSDYSFIPELTQGISHADDMLYIFPHEDRVLSRPLDITIAKRMVDMFTEFISTGDPTPAEHPEMPEFIAYHRDEGNYMRVDQTMRMQGGYRHAFTTAHRDGLERPAYAGAAALAAPLALLLAATLLARI